MLGISTSNLRVGGYRGKGNDADAVALYSRIIADGGVSNLTRLNFFVKGLKTIYGSLTNVPVCYDAHWIGYKLGSGTGATAGQAAAKLYSLTVAGDAVQATAASQPLLLSHNGASSDNYWWGSGVSQGALGNHCSTPNASANQIIGDIEIIAKVDYVNNSAIQMMVTKGISASWQYDFYIGSDNTLNLQYALNGAPNVATTKTSSVAISSPYSGWLKVTRNTSTGDVKFFTSSDNITYTQLGTTQSGTIGNLNSTTSNVYIGAYAASLSSSFNFQGRIYRATISNSIGGAPVVDFNPATYNAATSQTAWTSSTGEVWTINTGTATSGYKGVLVNRTIVMSDGVDDNMVGASVVVPIVKSLYSSVKVFNINNTAVNPVFDSYNTTVQNFEGKDTPANGWLTAQGGLTFTRNTTSSNLNLYNSIRNAASSAISINNSSDTTGVLLAGSAVTGIVIMGYRTLGTSSNIQFNGFMISSAADNATTRTAMYNLIRSLNNNAF